MIWSLRNQLGAVDLAAGLSMTKDPLRRIAVAAAHGITDLDAFLATVEIPDRDTPENCLSVLRFDCVELARVQRITTQRHAFIDSMRRNAAPCTSTLEALARGFITDKEATQFQDWLVAKCPLDDSPVEWPEVAVKVTEIVAQGMELRWLRT